jgi:hypothetical protein
MATQEVVWWVSKIELCTARRCVEITESSVTYEDVEGVRLRLAQNPPGTLMSWPFDGSIHIPKDTAESLGIRVGSQLNLSVTTPE